MPYCGPLLGPRGSNRPTGEFPFLSGVLQQRTVTPRDTGAWETCNEDRLFWILDRHIKKMNAKNKLSPCIYEGMTREVRASTGSTAYRGWT